MFEIVNVYFVCLNYVFMIMHVICKLCKPLCVFYLFRLCVILTFLTEGEPPHILLALANNNNNNNTYTLHLVLVLTMAAPPVYDADFFSTSTEHEVCQTDDESSSESSGSDSDNGDVKMKKNPCREAKTKGQISQERKIDNRHHTNFVKAEVPVSITPHAQLTIAFAGSTHPFSPLTAHRHKNKDLNIRGSDPNARRVMWASKAKLVMSLKEHAYLVDKKYVTHPNSHPNVKDMPLAHNNCRSLVTRCRVPTCRYVCKSHASLVYVAGGNGTPTGQTWETTDF